MLNKGGRKYDSYRRPARTPGRGRWLRRLAGVAVATLLLTGALGLVYRVLAHSAWFRVSVIDIQGNTRLSREQVLELSGVDLRSNLVALSSRTVRERLAGNAWVATAAVTRYWPNRLEIRLQERVPVAILNRDGQLFYLDRQGVAFAQVQPHDDLDYPVISGTGRDWDSDRGGSTVLAEAMQLLRLAGGGNPNLPSQNISEINVGDPDCLVLYLMSRPFPIRLGRGEMKNKYDRLAKVLSGLYRHREFSSITYIDLDYRDGQILVRFAGGQGS